VVNERGWQRELREMENRVDELCLLAFDVYVKCREKIWELKANEARQRVSYILRKWDKQQSRKGESSEEVPKA
jgi:transcriptional regulator with AAA-type ATPase domain